MRLSPGRCRAGSRTGTSPRHRWSSPSRPRTSHTRAMLPVPGVLYIVEVSGQGGAHLANTESDWLRRAGVLIGVAGTILATPGGVASLWLTARKRATALWARIKRLLRRRDGAVDLGGAVSTSKIDGTATVEPWQPWIEDAPVDRKVEILHIQVGMLQERIRDAQQAMRLVETTLRGELGNVKRRLNESHQRLAEDIEAERRRSSRVDARGLAPIAFSIILAGIPDELAAVSVLGWCVLGVAITVTLLVARSWWPDFRQALKNE